MLLSSWRWRMRPRLRQGLPGDARQPARDPSRCFMVWIRVCTAQSNG